MPEKYILLFLFFFVINVLREDICHIQEEMWGPFSLRKIFSFYALKQTAKRTIQMDSKCHQDEKTT